MWWHLAMICCIVICLILSLTYSHFPTDVSFPLSVWNCWVFFSVELPKKSPVKKYKKVREVYISPYCRPVLVPPIFMKFGVQGQLTDIITCVKFLVDRFRGYGVLIPPKLPFPIDLLHHPYNSVALPCDTVTGKI